MGQLAGTVFGAPTIYPVPQNLGGFSPYAGQGFPYPGQGFGVQAFPQQPYSQGLMPVQQIAQLLQIVPQQLQQVQQLQQQQAQYLQQLLQWVPAQLQQLQQLVQLISHQSQQQQQGLPFGAGIAGPLTFGLSPQTFAGQATSHVM